MKLKIGRFLIKKEKGAFILKQSMLAKNGGYEYEMIGASLSLEGVIDELLTNYLLYADTKEINSVESLIKEIRELKEGIVVGVSQQNKGG